MKVIVECYAGYRGEETPRRFRMGEQWREVEEVVDRWLSPDHRYFKLRTPDGTVWILRHDTHTGDWEVTMFERPSGGGA